MPSKTSGLDDTGGVARLAASKSSLWETDVFDGVSESHVEVRRGRCAIRSVVRGSLIYVSVRESSLNPHDLMVVWSTRCRFREGGDYFFEFCLSFGFWRWAAVLMWRSWRRARKVAAV